MERIPENSIAAPGMIVMNLIAPALAFLPVALPVLMAGGLVFTSHAQEATEIGGQKVVTLTRTAVSTTKPEFTSIKLAPGRGMEIIQITANFPGKGNVDVLMPKTLAEAKQILDVNDDEFGNLGYRLGAAFLAPYPNRIRGKLSADTKTLTTEWEGHAITLPANNGRQAGGDIHAMHGLILKRKTDEVKVSKVPGGEQVVGVIHAGDFGGHWLSKTDLVITVTLTADDVDASIVAHNVGGEAEPFALAWHPYFNFPSGDRTQAKIQIPGSTTAVIDNYTNVYPTGKIGVVTVQIVDPAAKYGLKIEGLSPEISSIQMYAPPTSNFVAIEHQYNLADPFSKIWGATKTGMVTLKPGESTKWHVRLKVFVP
jgi:galactose mutarotase-like enzyme